MHPEATRQHLLLVDHVLLNDTHVRSFINSHIERDYFSR